MLSIPPPKNITNALSSCFTLTANGGPGGSIGQIGDGQNRIGDTTLSSATYCIDGNGGTSTDQCDAGAAPTPGFSVDCAGTLQYKNSSTFWSCPTGDNGGWNIYTVPVKDQLKCLPVTLQASGCNSACPAPPPPAPSTKSCLPSSTSPSATPTCPLNLIGTNFEFPHLIIPLDRNTPITPLGNSLNGTLGGTKSSAFNFDIPASDAGSQCTLVFLFPTQSQMQTSAYTYTNPNGNGTVQFTRLVAPAARDSAYSTVPGTAELYPPVQIRPGGKFEIAQFPCPAGETIGLRMSPYAGDVELEYFQDFNPCPIGLYITVS
ncbi:hypothetical protein BAUCODRAFT_124327 [Baudoinia panamericana UAMH 10762]|uniref:Uncharacterized protein n=1 Tax=Baudoinia panamericana (strain UAMH 10762) TaxID=717646 RepID=M2N6N4_BAUPA|nr:uncharacterized protein BAUCODRAFT_124327 [Baudoinia panamericana UAMH 10762]EMC94729.1 hypothetical protein BAUCODRAFT_124327 [Baudoinia panamericana UAMH 10762]